MDNNSHAIPIVKPAKRLAKIRGGGGGTSAAVAKPHDDDSHTIVGIDWTTIAKPDLTPPPRSPSPSPPITAKNYFGRGTSRLVSAPLLKFSHYNDKLDIEVGVDEAGRGPFLGPVYVGAVVFPPCIEAIPDDANPLFRIIRDSKKLSPENRRKAADLIKRIAIDWAIAFHDNDYIDTHNILNATYDTMHAAIRNIKRVKPTHIIVDGERFRSYVDEGRFVPHTCVIDGDKTHYSIAAASILAKVAHDEYIAGLITRFPILHERFDIGNNMGYGTPSHLAGISHWGISQFHRKSFGICKTAPCRIYHEDGTISDPISETITIPPIHSTIPPIHSTIPPIHSTIPPIHSTIIDISQINLNIIDHDNQNYHK
jgi:ribonuclease HII